MIARLPGTMNAAPAPWMARAAINRAGVGAGAEPIEAITNTPMPAINTLRSPNRSLAAPPSNSSDDSVSRYALDTHWASASDAPMLERIAGVAIEVTVPSMNPIADARI